MHVARKTALRPVARAYLHLQRSVFKDVFILFSFSPFFEESQRTYFKPR